MIIFVSFVVSNCAFFRYHYFGFLFYLMFQTCLKITFQRRGDVYAIFQLKFFIIDFWIKNTDQVVAIKIAFCFFVVFCS